ERAAEALPHGLRVRELALREVLLLGRVAGLDRHHDEARVVGLLHLARGEGREGLLRRRIGRAGALLEGQRRERRGPEREHARVAVIEAAVGLLLALQPRDALLDRR